MIRIALAVLASTFSIASAAPASMSSTACRHWLHLAKNMKTDQLAVANASGEMLFSWTDGVYKTNSPHQLFSASKTITSTLAATAIQEGKLSLDDRLSKFFPSRREFREIRVGDLFAMTSGVKWTENEETEPKKISVLPMLYTKGYRDVVKHILGLEFTDRPGRVWNYSSANTNLAMAVLRRVYGRRYDDMPWKNLFEPLGIKTARIEQDQSGNYLGAAYVYMSAEDLTKFGALFLNDGVAHGRRLLPPDWVARSERPVAVSTAKVRTREQLENQPPYGQTGFWLNTPVEHLGRPMTKAPGNTLMVSGLFGQWLFILPDQKLSIARTGHGDDANANLNDFVSGAVACFSGK